MHVAGFIGENAGTISNSYTTGIAGVDPSTTWEAAFAYINSGRISDSYAIGYAASAKAQHYGFVETNNGGVTDNDFFYILNGTINPILDNSTATALTKDQSTVLSSYPGFDPSIWSASSHGYPILGQLPVFVTSRSGVAYGSASTSILSDLQYAGFQDGDTPSQLAIVAPASGNLDAGTFGAGSVLTSSVYARITGSLTITPQALTLAAGVVAGVVADKTYDGTNSATVNNGLAQGGLVGLVGNETLNVNYLSAVFDDKNAGQVKAATVSFTASDSTNGGKIGNTATPGNNYYINNLTTNSDGSVTVGPASITLSGANATLAVNGQFYTLIPNMDALAALSQPILDGNGNPAIDPNTDLPEYTPATGFYALGQDLMASQVYPGAVVNTLTGVLAGLGHKISNLTINDTTNTGGDGLIGNLGSFDFNSLTVSGVGPVRDLGLVNVNVTTNSYQPIGGLAGNVYAGSMISNVYVKGAVTGINDVGGLVGQNQGTIDNAHADTSVSALNGGTDVGGLVGFNTTTGIITNSTARGSVTAGGVEQSDGGLLASGEIGGFVGFNAGILDRDHSYTQVKTTDSVNVGGLVGLNLTFDPAHGVISNSSSGGTLDATWLNTMSNGFNYGGLVGDNEGGSITNVSSSTNVTVIAQHSDSNGDAFATNVGGLVGSNNPGYNFDTNSSFGGTITNGTVPGTVTTIGSVYQVDNLIGSNSGTVSGVTYVPPAAPNPIPGGTGSTGTSTGAGKGAGSANTAMAMLRSRPTRGPRRPPRGGAGGECDFDDQC